MRTLVASDEPPRPHGSPLMVSVTTSSVWFGGATNVTFTTTIGFVPAAPAERGPFRTQAHVGHPVLEIEGGDAVQVDQDPRR